MDNFLLSVERNRQLMKSFLSCCLCIFVLMMAPPAARAESTRLPQGPFGSRDFVQYWSLCRLIEAQSNPYDPAAMYAVQQKAGFAWDEPVMSWNPPWSYALLCPFMPLELGRAATAWAGLNALFLFAAALLFYTGARGKRNGLAAAGLLTALYLPAWDNVLSGQLGLLLTLGLGLFYFLMAQKQYFPAGLSLSLLSLKPHLFLLMAVPLVFEVLRKRNLRLLAGAATGMGVLLFPVLALKSELLGYWWSAITTFHHGTNATSILEWQPDALVGALRACLRENNMADLWLLWCMPLAGVSIAAAILAHKGSAFSWQNQLPPLTCLSLLFAPYAWFSDQSLLLILPIVSVAQNSRAQGRLTRSVVLWTGLTLLGFLAARYYNASLFQLAMLGGWFINRPQTPSASSSSV